MALEAVTQEIIKSAKDKAAAIGKEADEEVAKINAEADAKISELKENEDRKLKEAVERLNHQELSSAELESKKIALAKKKEILSKAFEETLAGLAATPKSKKLEQYKAMVKVAKGVIDNPKAIMSEDDDFSAEDLGVDKVEKDARIKGGLILQSEDGDVEVDLQYSTILRSIWDREIKSVSDILFG